MLRRGLVRAGWFLIALAPQLAVAGGTVTVIRPDAQEILFGATLFAFDVEHAEPAVERIDVFVGRRLVGTALAPDWSFEWEAPADVSTDSVLALIYVGGNVVERIEIPTRKIGMSQGVGVSLVQLYPVVLDRKGRYILDLDVDAFEVLDQGSPVPIKNFSVQTTRSRIGLLLDVSNSMESKISVLREASSRFVSELGERHAVSVYTFNHALQRLASGSRDTPELRRSIGELRAGGGTALYDALIQVLDEMQRLDGRRAVFVFSDGRDERSLTSKQSVIRRAVASDVIIYAVGTQVEKESAPRDDLEALAAETGGRSYFVQRAEDLYGVFDEVLRDLEAQYVLSYPPPKGQAGVRAVEVRVTDPRYDVRCRSQYLYDGD